MTKRYIANINASHWDGKRDCSLFRTKTGQEIETDDIRIQKRCEALGFEEITDKENEMRIEHNRVSQLTTEKLSETQKKRSKNKKTQETAYKKIKG